MWIFFIAVAIAVVYFSFDTQRELAADPNRLSRDQLKAHEEEYKKKMAENAAKKSNDKANDKAETAKAPAAEASAPTAERNVSSESPAHSSSSLPLFLPSSPSVAVTPVTPLALPVESPAPVHHGAMTSVFAFPTFSGKRLYLQLPQGSLALRLARDLKSDDSGVAKLKSALKRSCLSSDDESCRVQWKPSLGDMRSFICSRGAAGGANEIYLACEGHGSCWTSGTTKLVFTTHPAKDAAIIAQLEGVVTNARTCGRSPASASAPAGFKMNIRRIYELGNWDSD